MKVKLQLQPFNISIELQFPQMSLIENYLHFYVGYSVSGRQ